MKRPPNVIYLQWKNDEGEEVEQRTWCEDKIYKHDIRYLTYERSVIDVEEYHK